MHLQKLFLIGTGGFLGSAARYLVSRSIDDRLGKAIPYGTFAVNIIGSFLLGIIYAIALKKLESGETIRMFWGIGFCGGFTTFSTFAWENLGFIRQENLGAMAIYIVASLVFGLLAIWGGFSLGRGI